MSKPVDHFIITRFHVRINDQHDLPDEEWIRSRIPLFERFCLPSMNAQESQNHRWLVLIDEHTPVWVENYLTRRLPAIATAVRVSGICEGSAVSEAVFRLASTRRVITSRLDSDDTIANKYTHLVRSLLADSPSGTFLNFPDGFQYSRQRLLHYSHPSNAFISCVSERSSPEMLTVFAGWHDRLASYGDIRQAPGHYVWAQTCHGGNAINRERGIRADHRKHSSSFPWLTFVHHSQKDYLADLLCTCVRATHDILSKPSRLQRLGSRLGSHLLRSRVPRESSSVRSGLRDV